jgi:hypothetical protein
MAPPRNPCDSGNGHQPGADSRLDAAALII